MLECLECVGGATCETWPGHLLGDVSGPRAPAPFTTTQECAEGRGRDGMTRRSPVSVICSAFCSAAPLSKDADSAVPGGD